MLIIKFQEIERCNTMCGYDPFYWYETELDRDYIAWINGFDNYEEYYNSMKDDFENRTYNERMEK